MASNTTGENEAILAQVESFGGGYVWEPEIFAITVMDVAVTDEQALILLRLTGVEQIAINVSLLSLSTLQAIASIPGLQSLILSGSQLTTEQHVLIEKASPKIELLYDEL